MKEHPILFSPPMVRAILEGRKTQTRRVVSVRNSTVLGHPGSGLWSHLHFDYDSNGHKTWVDGPNDTIFGCGPSVQYLHVPAWHPDDSEDDVVSYRVRPKWEPGDRLWVRETWQPFDEAIDGFKRDDPVCVAYAADKKCLRFEMEQSAEMDTSYICWAHEKFRKWKPSIHMPRWASRITLEVTEVRVERVQDISEEDAIAEGAMEWWNELSFAEQAEMYNGGCGPVAAFHMLWDSINGKKHPWDSNPLVWVVSFQRENA